MKSFYIDLNEASSKKPRIRRLLLFGAVICIVFTLLSLSIFITFHSSLEWFFLISAVYLALYIYYAWITFKTKLFVKADGSGVDFKFGIRANSTNYFIWDSISRVRIGYAYLAFYKKSGRRNKVQLNWLPYSKVVEIKEKLIEMCDDRKVPYEKVDFIDYSVKKDKKGK